MHVVASTMPAYSLYALFVQMDM